MAANTTAARTTRGVKGVSVKDSNVFNYVRVGDNVKVTYTEALVIDVMTPAAAKK
jgi:hypothetical protein